MKFNLRTWYKSQDQHGNSISCLSLYVETASNDFRSRIQAAIEKALADPEPKVEKQSAIGFSIGHE